MQNLILKEKKNHFSKLISLGAKYNFQNFIVHLCLANLFLLFLKFRKNSMSIFIGWTDRHNGKNKIYKLCEYYYNLHFISLKNCNTLHKETSFEFKHFRFENLDQMDFLYFLIHVGLRVDYRYMYICEYLHVFTVKTQYINTHS